VLDALTHLYDPVVLQTHPLARMLAAGGAVGATPGDAGEALRRRLLDAIAHLRPPAKAGEAAAGAWRRHRLLELRYVEAVGPRAVQEQLGIEKSQYYREHARALAAVVRLLEQRWPGAPAPDGTGDSKDRAEPPPLIARVPSEAVGRADEQASRGPELPCPLTSFVGREREVAVLRAWLLGEGVRLVTLTGPGGIGKTRLAVEVASAAAGGFAHGASFVALAPLAEPDHVASAIAQALGVRERGGEALVETLKHSLRPRDALLVLDNFEHLLDAAPLVAGLLACCPRLKVLATSRAPLRVSGEQAYPVPALALPDGAATGMVGEVGALEALAAVESVRLFVARARAARPGFALTAADAPAVIAICRRLDGLPLALELAAARVRHLPPAALLARLELPSGGLPLLTGGARDAPARQRTLRDAIAWSHALLAPAEQALFRRLGVFAGGFSLPAAEAVCSRQVAVGSEGVAETSGPAANAGRTGLPTEAGLDVLDGLSALVDASLVEQLATGPANARNPPHAAPIPRPPRSANVRAGVPRTPGAGRVCRGRAARATAWRR
jgi:predicted ATPase